MTTWPSGIRDTTEFPEMNIAVSGELRQHLAGFLQMEGVPWTNYDAQQEISGLEVAPQRLRTYRKMYEQLGLLYPSNNCISLSPLGQKLKSLESQITEKRDCLVEEITRIAIGILARYQFKNPVDDSNDQLPHDFDVFPFYSIWLTMDKLDGKLHTQELNRVLLRVEKMSDLPNAILRISSARTKLRNYEGAGEQELSIELGEEVENNQPSARMAAWFSTAGWGGLIITRNADSSGFRNLTERSRDYLSQILNNPPEFYQAQSQQDWFDYYLGISKQTDLKIEAITREFSSTLHQSNLRFTSTVVQRFLTSLLTKKFVILTGLAGSGKTKIIEMLSCWLCNNQDQYRMVAVGADWTTNENLLGYSDAIQQGIYRAPNNGALDLILCAQKNSHKPYFLILDEMNLSHVERYFADFLSAMESASGVISLHGESGKLKAGDMEVPPTIKLPDNLFIIGTVNIDETTYMFSPKVLDRANVIEFRASADQMTAFLDNPAPINLDSLTAKGTAFASSFVNRAREEATLVGVIDGTIGDIATQLKNDLIKIFSPLAEVGAEFGFRTAKEIARFVAIHRELSGDDWNYVDALDAQVVQKLMPKLHGSARKLDAVLKALHKFAGEKNLPLTKEKIERMQERLKRDGFTSFAEA